ncbi:Shugoshin-like protein [Emericellopsis cladophorae]|uniref:Shugoshin-like protein n=1 Tax=Emericellopsis cladophorae TaxID=2686198 RepID=A0A9Q0BD08_9HYPO|nr:Shugoshin-like protein [Emericellopsis cladophorae]KAI6780877.1 Shugoshin-like protein [Emericellopsis cladophorae]
MARLNEVGPMSAEAVEILRRKMMRQNRDLARSNNVRAQRVRELEMENAELLQSNDDLRQRIRELERQAEDSEARRVTDHTMGIKAKLEAQLADLGNMISELGSDPPRKKRSPGATLAVGRRTSFSYTRPSPSQRRLREVARDVEELGHISEHKMSGRRSMNPEQIMALRTEADCCDPSESPELGPPPTSDFIRAEPFGDDIPQDTPTKGMPSPRGILQPIVARSPSPSPRKRMDPSAFESITSPPTSGVKRKFASQLEPIDLKPKPVPQAREGQEEDSLSQSVASKQSIKERTQIRPLKELSSTGKGPQPVLSSGRRPLGVKSTNDDVASPKKRSRTTPVDDVSAAKANINKARKGPSRSKAQKIPQAPPIAEVKIEAQSDDEIIDDELPKAEVAPQPMGKPCDLGAPLVEPELLAPNSPDSAPAVDTTRGDTPPPADINSQGEASRPSRRRGSVVSYAEPNLRDKMRRPGKQLVDAVTSRRSSQQEILITQEHVKVKRESTEAGALPDNSSISARDTGAPASPTVHGTSPTAELPSSVATERRKRPSASMFKLALNDEGDEGTKGSSNDSNPTSDSDVYDMTMSPQPARTKRKGANRGTKGTRRFSSATGSDDEDIVSHERSTSRRRSMMV